MWKATGFVCVVALAVWPPAGPDTAASGTGAVVVEMQEGLAAARAGLRPGDVLLEWRRTAGGSGPSESGRIDSPFDLDEAEREQAPRGRVELRGFRRGAPLAVHLPGGSWKLTARPRFSGVHAALYEHGRGALRTEPAARGTEIWNGLARALRRAGDPASAAWLHLERARLAADERDAAALDAALEEARSAARASRQPDVVASVEEAVGQIRESGSDWKRAAAAFQAAVAARPSRDAGSLREAWCLNRLGNVAVRRGDLEGAAGFHRRALEVAERLAPGSLAVASAQSGLGAVALYAGRMPEALDWFRKALALQERQAPGGLEVAASMSNLARIMTRMESDLDVAESLERRALAIRERLTTKRADLANAFASLGTIALARGDLAEAEARYRQALERESERSRESLPAATMLNNLGLVAAQRGRLAEAEVWLQQGLALRERLAPESVHVSESLLNLGQVARGSGAFSSAEEYYRRALAIQERRAPGSFVEANILANLGELARERRDFEAARTAHRRALAILQRLAPDGPHVAASYGALADIDTDAGNLDRAERLATQALSLVRSRMPGAPDTAEALRRLGRLAARRQRWHDAETYYREAAELQGRLAPGSAAAATGLAGLARVHRAQRRNDEALAAYRQALEALESQREALGGPDVVHATFATRYGELYHETLGLLVESGAPEEAFHVLERYRARGLLSLLARRDLVFSDLPPALDRERRLADAAYDQLASQAIRDGHDDRRAALEAARRRQALVRDRIRATAPQVAALRYPEPLDLAGARRALDPGTALLAYAIGAQSSYVFAVGPGPSDFRCARLETNRADLRTGVARLREGLSGGTEDGGWRREAARLGALLLQPIADFVARAERLVIVPDGALHLVPFAALIAPSASTPAPLLIEERPIHIAASATVFAELKKRRRASAPMRVVAFGDPYYSVARAMAAASPAPLAPATLRGLALHPLPAARREIRALEDLFSGVRAYVGADATEERAKAIGNDASVIHFACHGFVDEQTPMDSALALAIPREWRPGRDNGLLQMWEILEQMRVDADLVTLSACRTALGPEASGEGLLGLTRAFHYAGARSVLASLWEVNDLSTGRLMERFYAHLKDGRSKDAALQAAQLELLRSAPFAHPSRWAAFQVMGDWR